ncbi:MAG: DUF2330 domain-containing protein [Gemmatimonadales bacterium]|nr:DUF2330 domain-containing protein [Gemmatimonadales bacterium]
MIRLNKFRFLFPRPINTCLPLGILMVLTFLTILAGTRPVQADGGFFAPPQMEIYESSQIAFIKLADGQEDLMILPRFEGNARDFAWVIPVPGLPTLNTADPELFIQAATLTQPIYRNRDRNWGGCDEDNYYAVGSPEDGVQIISEELVGIYQTMIIGSDNADELVDYLTDWEFLNPGNTATIAPVLESYVEKGWYFVTLKVDESALEDELPNLPYYWYGQMDPIHLSFESEDMIYPLRISSLSAAESSEIIIYTVGEHRMTYPGAQTWYANRISADELSAINQRFPAVGIHLEEGNFLTKLVRSYTPAQMSEDLVLTPTSSDDEFRLINYSGFPLFNLLLGGSTFGWMIWRRASSRRRRQTG